MPEMMSQDSLAEELLALGYEVEKLSYRLQMCQRGISLRATAANGFTISIQAGCGLYSNPREKAVEYESVEVAVMNPAGEFVSSDEIFTDHEVAGWMDRDQMHSIMEAVKKWTPNPPFIKSMIGRPETKW